MEQKLYDTAHKFVADTEYCDGWISIEEANHKLSHLSDKDKQYILNLLCEDKLLYDETKLTKKEYESGRSKIKTKPVTKKEIKKLF